MYLKPGEKVTVEQLLYGLLLCSGNDAALALAEACCGSVEDFVAEMNRKAAQLGMEDSSFANPNGLDAEEHYSTARDMGRLAAEAAKNHTFVRLCSTSQVSIGTRTMTNHNRLLREVEGCIGMKTGYTERSGRTLISCAERQGQRLIAVTLNDGNDWADHTAMLDYGFATYSRVQLCGAGERFVRLPVKGSLLSFVWVDALDAVYYPLAEGEELRREISLARWTQAPVTRGQTAGTITWYLNDRVVAVSPLVYAQTAGLHVVRRWSIAERLFKREMS